MKERLSYLWDSTTKRIIKLHEFTKNPWERIWEKYLYPQGKKYRKNKGGNVKKLLLILVMGIVSVAKAESPIEGALFNFGDFFAKARVGYSVDQHLDKSTVLYASVQRFHDLSGVELLNVNAGYDPTNKHPLVLLGSRFDNIVPKIWGGEWGKGHVTTADLPAIEFGPYASVWPKMVNGKIHAGFTWGFILAVGFAK